MIADLDCNDSIVWLLAIEQMIFDLVEKDGSSPRVCNNRDIFEKKVEKLIDECLAENKVKIIRTYKQES